MSKEIVFLYGGQGAQRPAMGADIAKHYSDFTFYQEPYCSAEERDWLFDPSFQDIHLTLHAQLALCLYQLSVSEILRAHGIRPQLCLGLSIGEFPALAVAGIYTSRDILKIVRKRAELMSRRLEIRKKGGIEEGMLAVLGLDQQKLLGILKDHPDLSLANKNSPSQFVISGEKGKLEPAREEFLQAGARRALLLEVEGAFHSPAFQEDVPAFKTYLQNFTLGEASCGFALNFTGKVYSAEELNSFDTDFWTESMSQQMSSTIHLCSCIEAILAEGYRNFVEFSPSPVLAPLIKRMDQSVSSSHISNVADLQNWLEENH